MAQVPQKVIVEHFTNTKCSVCASRNPGFYTNYNNQSGVMHIAYHPSSPYSACAFSQHNPSENDARTNYYGIYGGTPRLVIQGVVISSASDYNSASMFTPYLAKTSPASIKLYQQKFGLDSIHTRVVIKAEATHTLSNLVVNVGLAEDTIYYTGSNGENVHYDVFRKSLTASSGFSVTLPSIVGDSVVLNYSTPSNVAWNFSRIFSYAILQDAVTKEIIQAEKISAKTNQILSVNEFKDSYEINVFNNRNVIVIESDIELISAEFKLIDLSGRTVLERVVTGKQLTIDASTLEKGLYIYNLKAESSLIRKGKLVLPD